MTCINIPIKQSIHTHMDMHRQTHFASTSSSRCLCIHLPVCVCVGLLPLSNACIVYSCASYACVCVNFHSDVIVFLRCGRGRLFFSFSFSAPFFSAVLHTLPNEVIPHQKHIHTQTCALTYMCVCMCVSLFTP